MSRKLNINQISLSTLTKKINGSFIVSLSVNSLLDAVRYSSDDVMNKGFMTDSLRQLKWITEQINGLQEYVADIFEIYPDHPYRLKLKALFREIPPQIEKVQSAIIYINLNSINCTTVSADKSRLGVYLYNLNDTLAKLYRCLLDIKTQNAE